MNEIVEILMRRDENTREEAVARYEETKRLIDEALASGCEEEVEDILAEEIGLELDYIFCFI